MSVNSGRLAGLLSARKVSNSFRSLLTLSDENAEYFLPAAHLSVTLSPYKQV